MPPPQGALSNVDLLKLAAKVNEMSTAAKFRLAADLCEVQRYDLAELIGTRAYQELQLAQLFGVKK